MVRMVLKMTEHGCALVSGNTGIPSWIRSTREQIPNTGSYDLVISILWSRLGTKVSPAFVMPDGSQPKTANEYEIGWVLDQLNRTPGFPELRVYRNRVAPSAPVLPKPQREAFFRELDAVQEFFAAWENKKAFAEACSGYSDLEEFESLFPCPFPRLSHQAIGEGNCSARAVGERALIGNRHPFEACNTSISSMRLSSTAEPKPSGKVLDALAKQANSQTLFVLLLGASGSGKSSLVRAGVLPMLTEVGTDGGRGTVALCHHSARRRRRSL